MNRRQFIARTFSLFLAGLVAPKKLFSAGDPYTQASTFRLVFGSCCNQDSAQPVWQAIAQTSPDVFAFLGDNIYGDTNDMGEMHSKYQQLAQNSEFAQFRRKVPIVATWDDHDMGANDAGAEYPHKRESKKLFLDFFREPANSTRRSQNGIYTSYSYGAENQRVQLIMLDLRWFRSPLVRDQNGAYIPNPDKNATLLGAEQWHWLEEQLAKPADFRILGSSIQFTSSEHPWEKWANFPHEKARLMAMLDRHKIKNLLVISGDMHFGELSTETTKAGTPIYDFTSSGLNYFEPAADPNGKRVSLFDSAPNFGIVTVDWAQTPATVTMELRDETGRPQIRKHFSLAST